MIDEPLEYAVVVEQVRRGLVVYLEAVTAGWSA